MGKLIDFFKKYRLLTNLIFVVFATVLLVWLSLFMLDIYTCQGEKHQVPDVLKLDIETAENIIRGGGFNYEVVDSIYSRNDEPGCIMDQDPKPESYVKAGRKIYLILNARGVRMVTAPQVIDLSVRQAKALAQSLQFTIGEDIYVDSEYKNLVLGLVYNGKNIDLDQKLPEGSTIQLKIGKGANFVHPSDTIKQVVDSTDILLHDSNIDNEEVLFETEEPLF